MGDARMYALFARTRLVLRHPAIVGSALMASLLAFCLHPGAMGDTMKAVSALFVLNAAAGGYRFRTATFGHWVVLLIIAAVLLIHLAAPGRMVHDRSLSYLLLFPGVVMACHCLFRQLPDIRLTSVLLALTITLSLAVGSQLTAYWINKGAGLYGFYSNPHHLGLFASLTCPVLSEALFRFSGWWRPFFAASMMGALYLLWQSSSRVSWVSFFVATLFTCLVFYRKKQLALALLSVATVAALSVMASGPDAVVDRIWDLILNLQSEERMSLWPETISRLGDNTTAEWILGHGIGSFRYYFSDYALPIGDQNARFGFPHNAVLQLLFENGLLGFALVGAGFGGLLAVLFRSFYRFYLMRDRRAVVLLFLLLIIVAIHCLLTKSVYSKYILYSLGVIVGAALVVVERAYQENPSSDREALK